MYSKIDVTIEHKTEIFRNSQVAVRCYVRNSKVSSTEWLNQRSIIGASIHRSECYNEADQVGRQVTLSKNF